MKVRIKRDKQSKVKNGGMHLLGTFVPRGKTVEVDCDEKDLKELDQFKYWFEEVGAEEKTSRSSEEILKEIEEVESKIEDLEEDDEELDAKLESLEKELEEADQ